MSATGAAIQKKNKIIGYGMRSSDFAKWITLIISNKEMDDIMKIVNSLEKAGLLIKDVYETIKNESKEQKGRFF